MGLIDDLPTTGLGSRPHLEACLTMLEELVADVRTHLWADEIGKAYVAARILDAETAMLCVYVGEVVTGYKRVAETSSAATSYTPEAYLKVKAEWSGG